MTAPDLVSLERAKLALPSATAADERTIAALIAACSEAVRRHCRRRFALEAYDEVLRGSADERLLLAEYPVQSVESVRTQSRVVLEVTNTATATNQQARVTVAATGLILLRVASGVRSLDSSVSWASYPTLQGVATAVSALGNGWSARVVGSATGDYGLWPAADLYVPPRLGEATRSQGALDCRGRWAGLALHVAELSWYDWDARGWLARAGGWEGSWRVQYTAGFAPVPEAVQEATACWVAGCFHATRRDPRLATLAVVGATAQTWHAPDPRRPPAEVAALLAPYRRYTV